MSNVLSNLAAFIVALGVIIFVHEAGHLLMAKAFGMRVLTFSLGFGKRIWGFTRNETEYKVSLIPLGGYVRLGGEDPGEVSDDPRDFMNTPRWQRILVYLAGPAMNVILAILLIAGVLMVGIQVPTLPEIPPIIGSVAEESPAAAAGLLPGDEVLTANGKAAEDWEDVHFAFITSPERQVDLTVLRQGQERQVSLVPVKVPKYEFGYAGAFPTVLPRIAQVLADSPAEAAGFQPGDEIRSVDGQAIAQWQEFVDYIEAHADQSVVVEVLREQQPASLHVVPRDEGGKGRIGVAHGYYQQLGPGAALVESVRYNWQITRQTLSVLGKIVTGQLAAKSALSGPIEIAALSGAAARTGLKHLVQLMGLISISIAILNLMPIPVLDGGQITILMFEGLRRKDLSLRTKERINQVGFVFIVMLMVVVLYFDVAKNIPPGLLPGSDS